MAGDDELLVDIDLDIPVSVAAANGWVIEDEPADKEPAAKVPAVAKQPAASSDELESVRRIAETAQARGDALARTAEEERRARLKAEEEAQRNQTYALNAHLARVTADHDQLAQAITQWETHAEMAKRQMAQAAEAGDWNAHAEAQRAVAKAEASIAQLETGKAGAKQDIEAAKRARQAAIEAAQQRASQPQTREEPEPKVIAEDYIDQVRAKVGAPAADWLKDHKEFVTDGRLNRKMQAFVEDWADRNGENALRSAALREALEDRFFPKAKSKDTRESEDDTVSEPEEETPRRQPAAPVSRTNGAKPGIQTGAKGTKVRLSAEEAQTAVHMYPDLTPQDAQKRYATNKARLMSEGRL